VIGSSGLVGESFCRLYSSVYEIVMVDHQNYTEVLKMIKDDDEFYCDCVLFTAQSSDYKNSLFSKDLFDTNLLLLRETLEVFIDKTKKFIYFSSGSVYESCENEINESTPLKYKDKNPYVISKIASEMMLNTFDDYYQSIIVLRPFFIYGKHQNEQMLFKQLINKLIHREQIEIGQDGGLLFNPIYVDDVSKIVKVLIGEVEPLKQVINICGKESLYLKDIIFKLAKLLEVKADIVENVTPLKRFLPESKFEFINKFTSFDKGILDFENF